jgi:transcriptional regulator with XRE-family HTH domain
VSERFWYEQQGQFLRRERRKRGWTIYDVAAIAGVSGPAISRWESGTRHMHAYAYWQLRREGLLP